MNSKRLILAFLAVVVALFATNFLIHGVWLKNTYQETASLWRTDAEMGKRFGWMLLAQGLFAAMFTMLWAKGFATLRCAGCAVMYGLCMGLFSPSLNIITYVVSPVPASLVVKWVGAGLVQAVLLGLLAYAVYKPKPAVEAC